MSVQHLQEQVIQRNHLLHLHAVQVVHAFVTTDGQWKILHRSRVTNAHETTETGYKLSSLRVFYTVKLTLKKQLAKL